MMAARARKTYWLKIKEAGADRYAIPTILVTAYPDELLPS
jgi:hypothetical protein